MDNDTKGDPGRDPTAPVTADERQNALSSAIEYHRGMGTRDDNAVLSTAAAFLKFLKGK